MSKACVAGLITSTASVVPFLKRDSLSQPPSGKRRLSRALRVKIGSLALMLEILVGCSVDSHSQMPAPGESSHGVSPFDTASLYGSPQDHAALRKEYEAAKDLVSRIVEENENASNSGCADDPDCESESESELVAAVFDCGFTYGVDPSLELDEEVQGSTAALLILAKGAFFLEAGARGFPEQIWRPSLDRYVQDSLLAIMRLRFLEKTGETCCTTAIVEYPYGIVLDLRRYRDLYDRKLPLLVTEEGCGAGEFAVRFQTGSAARSLRIIPEFFARLCTAQKRSLNAQDCPYWMDISSGQEVAVSGIYRYEVTWQSGKITNGTVDTDSLVVSADENSIAIYRIEP